MKETGVIQQTAGDVAQDAAITSKATKADLTALDTARIAADTALANTAASKADRATLTALDSRMVAVEKTLIRGAITWDAQVHSFVGGRLHGVPAIAPKIGTYSLQVDDLFKLNNSNEVYKYGGTDANSWFADPIREYYLKTEVDAFLASINAYMASHP